MNFPDTLFSPAWSLTGWLLFAAVLFAGARGAPWKRLRNPRHLNVWLGSLVALSLLWDMHAEVHPGLGLHLLGATVMTLTVGPHLACIGLSIVLAGNAANSWLIDGNLAWLGFGLNALLVAVLPVVITQRVLRLVERYLPAHFFVYVFCTVFFGAALTVLLTGVAATALLWAANVYDAQLLLREFLPYFMLLAFAEAWLSGAIMTLMVVYRPLWVESFNDRRYLFNK